jgi:D-alanyl-D-alanine carboxypeptidase (penicillin-binding protein 5/6)
MRSTSVKHLRHRAIALLIAIVVVLPLLPTTYAQAFQTAAVPDLTAKAVYSIDESAGVELYAKNPDERLPPASTTKIATAIVVMNHVKNLEEQVQIAPDDVAASYESKMGVQAGDTLTVEQLMYGMMLPSGNDAARALARYVGKQLGGDDPIAAFVAEMNNLVTTLGLKNTHFTNPVGLKDDPDHYSSARDLAALANEALKNKFIAAVVRTKEITVTSVGPEHRDFDLFNVNQLLGQNGVHGVKSGSTDAAGGCLVVASWAHGRNRVITVILGSKIHYDPETEAADLDLRWDEMTELLQTMDRDYRWIAPGETDEVPGLHDEMAAWQVELEKPPSIVVPRNKMDTFHYRLQLGPPGKPRSKVGQVLFFIGSDQIAALPVYQSAAPEAASTPTRTAAATA